MVIIVVALTFFGAILAEAIVRHLSQKREVTRVKSERGWITISPAVMMPKGLKA
jgi:O-antigen/teichoic acid export membrane protein